MSDKPKNKNDKTKKNKQKNKAAVAALSRLLMYTTLRVEDLDPKILESRVAEMNKEIDEWKNKCKTLMQENEWYKNEIESCDTDTAEYTKYFEAKLEEKQGSIEQLMSKCQAELNAFEQKQKIKEIEHVEHISQLEASIHELERKIEIRQNEITTLSDTLTKRARHEAEIARLQKEIQDMELEHQVKVAEVERELLQARMKLKQQSDEKVTLLESQAHKNALKYLQDYTEKLKLDNSKLEAELRNGLQVTQQQEQQIKLLTKQNQQLSRERKIREDLINLRLNKIKQSQAEKEQQSKAAELLLLQRRKEAAKGALKRIQKKESQSLFGDALLESQSNQPKSTKLKTLEAANLINSDTNQPNVTLRDVNWVDDDCISDYIAVNSSKTGIFQL